MTEADGRVVMEAIGHLVVSAKHGPQDDRANSEMTFPQSLGGAEPHRMQVQEDSSTQLTDQARAELKLNWT
jgi:hypothetical protein